METVSSSAPSALSSQIEDILTIRCLILNSLAARHSIFYQLTFARVLKAIPNYFSIITI